MVEIFSISGLINALVAVSFGILVTVKNWRDRSNQLFFLMTISLAVWGIGYWQWLASVNTDNAFFWINVLSIGSVFIPVLFFHWVVKLLGKEHKLKLLVIASYTFCFFVSFFSFSSLFIVGVEPKSIFLFWPIPGILYSLYFFIIYSSLVIFSIYLLVIELLSLDKKSEKRAQILYIILGSVLGFGGGLTNFPLWYDVSILPVGTFLVALFPFLLGYAALKHHLFSFKTIATEILVFFIVVILLIQTTLSESTIELVLRSLFFAVVSSFGFLLIQSVYREVETRERIEKLAKQLELANVRLKELDQLKSEFVSIASHQLRSPLAAIKGYASLIIEGSFGKVPPAIHEAVDKIFDSSKGLTLVVEDFLNVSRIEQGRMKYEFAEADLEKLVKDTVEELMPSVQRKSLTISFGTDNKSPYKSYIDIGKIKQVLGNLIDNAIKYTPQGSIQVTLSKPTSEKIRIAISDTGVGIDTSTIPLLFAKFTRAKDANKVNITGTGLGLYVAKEMIDAHKGRIWAESAGSGRGSTFCFELQGLQSKMARGVVMGSSSGV